MLSLICISLATTFEAVLCLQIEIFSVIYAFMNRPIEGESRSEATSLKCLLIASWVSRCMPQSLCPAGGQFFFTNSMVFLVLLIGFSAEVRGGPERLST